MYVWTYVYTHVHVYVCAYVCVYMNVTMHECIYVCMFLCVCMHVCGHVSMYVYMYECLYACMYVRLCVYVLWLFIYVYTYAQPLVFMYVCSSVCMCALCMTWNVHVIVVELAATVCDGVRWLCALGVWLMYARAHNVYGLMSFGECSATMDQARVPLCKFLNCPVKAIAICDVCLGPLCVYHRSFLILPSGARIPMCPACLARAQPRRWQCARRAPPPHLRDTLYIPWFLSDPANTNQCSHHHNPHIAPSACSSSPSTFSSQSSQS